MNSNPLIYTAKWHFLRVELNENVFINRFTSVDTFMNLILFLFREYYLVT